jgi:DNA mismatch repair ATPase MutS
VYEAMGSKKGFVDAYVRLMRVAEGMKPEAALLRELDERMRVDGAPPSVQMKRLDGWVGWYELRETGIVHIVVNPLLLWDLNCLVGIERWVRNVGRRAGAWFEVLAEIEALASLSVLLHHDPSARMPEIAEEGEPFEAEAIAHPLLMPDARVANDVRLRGPGTCLIVTGSNMAGKSTLLRAVGVNIALALAGGPVIAERLRVPRVRLRASMRVADSLQSGASYFQAELSRLRVVVGHADEQPPIFFLLDELLRGTNAKARHIGARAVVRHLLKHGASGLVATHDVALSALETDEPDHVANVHFTDVIRDGEMIFDYRLRPGVVRTSNALRLLAQVGIEVEDDPTLPVDERAAALSEERAAPSE